MNLFKITYVCHNCMCQCFYKEWRWKTPNRIVHGTFLDKQQQKLTNIYPDTEWRAER
jgi:hypothetical protein